MGDFNAKVGDERVEDVVGPSGNGTVNKRGSRLLNGAKLMILPSQVLGIKTTLGDSGLARAPEIELFRSRDKTYPIFFQKKIQNAIKKSKSLPGADCDSDHIPVMCTFQIKLKKLGKAKANPKF
ncbi:craniofacial development protein 2-like [Plakobranchus ocellatus]|uniref:Craniofacial development protein 2-like n=1 Tax=Plakobranchus ocellatus TaxID=259542 RepID=A0AAV3Y426_9GAST|nr:craniofacial development protein 2-like [Plakobranchus ocellatus]